MFNAIALPVLSRDICDFETVSYTDGHKVQVWSLSFLLSCDVDCSVTFLLLPDFQVLAVHAYFWSLLLRWRKSVLHTFHSSFMRYMQFILVYATFLIKSIIELTSESPAIIYKYCCFLFISVWEKFHLCMVILYPFFSCSGNQNKKQTDFEIWALVVLFGWLLINRRLLVSEY